MVLRVIERPYPLTFLAGKSAARLAGHGDQLALPVPDAAVFFKGAVQEMVSRQIDSQPPRSGAGAEVKCRFRGGGPSVVSQLRDVHRDWSRGSGADRFGLFAHPPRGWVYALVDPDHGSPARGGGGSRGAYLEGAGTAAMAD